MPKLLQVGELAKQTGLSIRTLRYYDEIGLLVPSHRTEAEYRLYSEADIARLQQILSLRQLDFSLKEIRECLENPDFSLPNVIDLHLARLQEQMTVSQSLFTKLSTLAQQFQTSRVASVDDLLQIMENLTMTQQYLTQEQNDLLEARLNKGNNDGQTQWLLDQARSHMVQGRDFNDPEVRHMASQFRHALLSLVDGDLQLYEALMQVYQKEGAEAATLGALDAPTFDYILKAMAILSVREDMVDFSLDPFTPESREVLIQGQKCMEDLHLDFFGTEGLLLGLLAVETSSVAQALNNQGVDFVIAQDLIQKLLAKHNVADQKIPSYLKNLKRKLLAKYTVQLPRTPSDTKIPSKISFTPRAHRVVELATEQAKQQGQARMTPQHLLLGLLRESEIGGEAGGGLAMHVLKECAVDCQKLKQQLDSA
ncbi:MAG: MerR family transcriptional regulator [Cyanophyceae cyanobacterium]